MVLKSKGSRVSQDSQGRMPWAPEQTSFPTPSHGKALLKDPCKELQYKGTKYYGISYSGLQIQIAS